MSTIAPVFVEFRCNRCWYSNIAEETAVGTEVGCRNCGNKLSVPEATPERIENANALLRENPELLSAPSGTEVHEIDYFRAPQQREMVELARKAAFVPLDRMDFSGYPLASLMTRLIASIVDNILTTVSLVAGFFLVMWLSKKGIIVLPQENQVGKPEITYSFYVPFCSFFSLLTVVQWYLLSTSGQTIGKKLCMIRIVTQSGQVPGFVRAVVLRNWVRNFLSCVPLFSLLDILFIFSDSRRCLHDWFAGTKVISTV